MCCLVACNRAEEGLIGRVVKVSDGDTITVLSESINPNFQTGLSPWQDINLKMIEGCLVITTIGTPLLSP